MPDLRPVFFVVGLMIAALGALMFIPMIVDVFYEGRSWRAFMISGLLTLLFGAALEQAGEGRLGIEKLLVLREHTLADDEVKAHPAPNALGVQ